MYAPDKNGLRNVRAILAKSSRNFYLSSQLFPKLIRQNVTVLYAFVRTVDNLVDSVPQQLDRLDRFEDIYRSALNGQEVSGSDEAEFREIIALFVGLQGEYRFEQEWVDSFIHSMRLDISKHRYERLSETLEYIYGSAEIVGLCIMRMLDLPDERGINMPARMVGRAFQYINFLRDIHEDWGLGRTYLPMSECGLGDLSPESVRGQAGEYTDFVRRQLDRYFAWYREGSRMLVHTPFAVNAAVSTAGSIFCAIGRKIYQDPLLVYQKRIEIPKIMILAYGVWHFVRVGVYTCTVPFRKLFGADKA